MIASGYVLFRASPQWNVCVVLEGDADILFILALLRKNNLVSLILIPYAIPVQPNMNRASMDA